VPGRPTWIPLLMQPPSGAGNWGWAPKKARKVPRRPTLACCVAVPGTEPNPADSSTPWANFSSLDPTRSAGCGVVIVPSLPHRVHGDKLRVWLAPHASVLRTRAGGVHIEDEWLSDRLALVEREPEMARRPLHPMPRVLTTQPVDFTPIHAV